MKNLGKVSFFILPIIVLFMVLMLIASPNTKSNLILNAYYSGLQDETFSKAPPLDSIFRPTETKLSLKHQNGTAYHWLRIEIPNLANTSDPVLVISPHIITEFMLYKDDNFNEPISHQTRFDFLPDAAYTNQNKVVDLTPHKDAKHFYILFKEIRSISIEVSLWEEKNFLAKDLHTNSFFSAIMFGLFLMLVINSFFYISIKDASYLYYILYHSSLLVLILNITGFLYHYPSLAWLGSSFSTSLMFLGLSSFFFGSFVRSFLNTKLYTPRFNKLIILMQLILIGLLITNLIIPSLSHILVHAFNAIALIGIPVYSTVMLLHLRLGNRQAVFFTLAFTLFLFASVFRILFIWDLVPGNFFTQYGVIIAIFIEAIIFSIGLTDKVLQLKQERDSANLEKDKTTFAYTLERDFNRLLSSINAHVHNSNEADHRQFIVDAFFNEFKESLGVVSNAVVYKTAAGIQKVLDTHHQNGYHYQIIEANIDRIEQIARKNKIRKIVGKNAQFIIVPVRVRQHEWSAAVLELAQSIEKDDNVKSFINNYSKELIRSILNAESINEIKTKAELDELTLTYNRGAIEDFVDLELHKPFNKNNPLSIAFIDFDDFKSINDQHGHQAGDLCLIQMADTFRTNLPVGAQIGRFGGDEFVIILPETNQFKALNVINRAKNKLKPIEFGDNIIIFSISIGIASQISGSDTMESLVERADKALYESKDSGKNTISVA